MRLLIGGSVDRSGEGGGDGVEVDDGKAALDQSLERLVRPHPNRGDTASAWYPGDCDTPTDRQRHYRHVTRAARWNMLRPWTPVRRAAKD